MNLLARRVIVTTAAASLCISGFAAVAQAHGGGSSGSNGFRGAAAPALFGHAIHAEGVIQKRDGTFVTVGEQVGTSSAASATSLTVTSADSFARTYVVTSATRLRGFNSVASLPDGTKVRVLATKTGDTWTANSIQAPRVHKHHPEPGESHSPSKSA